MGQGTEDFKKLVAGNNRGYHPEIPTQAMPTPRTCGQKTLAEAMRAVRQATRTHTKSMWFGWVLELKAEHGAYDPTPVSEGYEPLSWLGERFDASKASFD